MDLLKLLLPYLDESFLLSTRIHAFNNYIRPKEAVIYIKRDDELSSGIVGSKFRKYASLLPAIIAAAPDEVIIIGSANSNNICSLLQLLVGKNFNVRPMLLRANTNALMGNELWTQLLIQKEKIIYIDRDDWPNVNLIAETYRKKAEVSAKKVIVIPEGAAIKEALAGAITLAADVLLNEEKSNINFNHLFVDSGTGLSAIGLILGIGITSKFNRKIHITLIAADKEYFIQQLQLYKKIAENLFNFKIDLNNVELIFYKPIIAASFGAVNAAVLKETVNIARSEGILMEPVYSVKHLFTVKNIIENERITGNCLFIYSGGSFALAGWQNKLSELMGK